MEPTQLTFPTDTATLCAFDPTALEHRMDDAADWWTVPRCELLEVNAGNVAFFGLGSDGVFQLSIVEKPVDGAASINVKVPSGRLFLGAGEEVSSGGMGPQGLRGMFISLTPGNYVVAAKRDGTMLSVCFTGGGDGCNQLTEPVVI